MDRKQYPKLHPHEQFLRKLQIRCVAFSLLTIGLFFAGGYCQSRVIVYTAMVLFCLLLLLIFGIGLYTWRRWG